MFEKLLSILFPPKLPRGVRFQSMEEKFDPFYASDLGDGVGLRMYDVRATGIEKERFKNEQF